MFPLNRFAKVLIFGAVTISSAFGATNPHVSVRPKARIVSAIDNTQLTPLPNSHPARVMSLTDLGRLDPSTEIHGLTLVLKGSDEQEYALISLLDQQQKVGHENYHQWMTPQSFGATFGVESTDMAKITGWLQASGFTVDKVTSGARIVEFSGKSGAVETAFHTVMHSYRVNGETRFSNSTDISIPAALAPVVRGVARLNNFRAAKPRASLQTGVRDADGTMHPASSGAVAPLASVTPEFTNPAAPVTGTAGAHYVGGADYAAIYDTTPLLNKGINGSGVSIGLVEDSDINTSDVQMYRNIFGLPVNNPTIIHAGTDTGIYTYDDVAGNADVIGAIDAEVSGAVAPMAQIYYVVAGNNPIDLSQIDDAAVYLVDNNLTDIISMNFGLDETDAAEGANGNGVTYAPYYYNGDVQFFQVLWEQAAAQGQSVFVSSGIGGPDEADIFLAAYDATTSVEPEGTYSVNMYASTDFNVAVGSTEFNEGGTAYSLTGAVAPYWAAAATAPPYATALGYIPENAWDQSADGTVNGAAYPGGAGIFSSGGGVSAYNPLPSWQAGTNIGVPTTDPAVPTGYGAYPSGYLATTPGPHRLLPDVAMASGDSHDGTIVCYEGNCTLTSTGLLSSFGVVTAASASTASMAGIQALINQSAGGRQGNPNFYYYPIANAQNETNCNASTYPVTNTGTTASCGFHDITVGSTYIPANTKNTSKIGWPAGVGYDLTTGLGSPDAANLASLWGSVQFSPTTVGLNVYDLTNGGSQVQPIVINHGDSIDLTVNVYPVNSSGTPISGNPTGDVSIIAVGTGQGGVGFYNITNGGCANYTPTVPITAGVLTSTAGSSTTGYLYTLTFTGNEALGNVDLVAAGGYVVFSGIPTSSPFAFLNGTEQYVTASTGTTFAIEYGSVTTIADLPATTTAISPAATATSYAAQLAAPLPTTCGGTVGDGNPYDALNNGSLQLGGNFPGLPGGTYNLYAHYAGDTTYAPSNSQLVAVTVAPETDTLEVDPYSATVGSSSGYPTVTGPAATATYGLNVYLDTYVIGSSGYGTPTGNVTYTITSGSTTLTPVTATLDPSGDTYFLAGAGLDNYGILDQPPNYGFLPVGTYNFSASYSGDASFSPSTAPSISFTVTPATSKVTLTNETADIPTGGSATLFAYVSNAQAALYASGPATALPSGTFSFADTTTNTQLGTCTVAPTLSGTTQVAGCTFLTPAGLITTTGAHSIVATFTDTDGNYTSGVASKAATVTVASGATTTLTLTAPAQAQVGPTAAMIKATVGYTGSTAPTGTVVFYGNGNVIGTGTLSAGSATASISDLSAGTYTITAVYGGSSTFAQSKTTSSVTLTVVPNTPTVTIAAPATGDIGTGYAIQAVLKANPNNFTKSTFPIPAPNTTVTFSETTATSTIALGTAAMTVDPSTLDAVANLNTTAVVPGPGVITATYVGDSNYTTTSASETVNIGATNLGLSVTAPTSYPTIGVGESVTFKAVVTPQVNTKTAVGGTVQFYDNNVALGSPVTVVSTGTSAASPYTVTGVATLTIALPTSSTSDIITAQYSGDTHFYASNGTLATTITTTAPGFTIAANPTALSIASGSSGSVAVTATVFGNWTGNAPLVCSGLPANAACTFAYSPNTPPITGSPLNYFTLTGPNGTYTGTLTITASANAEIRGGSASAGFLWLPAILFAGLLGIRRRQLSVHGKQFLTLLVLLCGALAMTACGSGGTAASQPGTYNVTITANGTGSTSASPTTQPTATITLTVIQ